MSSENAMGCLVFVSRSLFVLIQHTRPFPIEIAVEIGGASFSDVTGSIQDPIDVPGPC